MFDDNCEALGELHETWNIPGHRFVDWCMWGMKTEYLKQLAILLNRPDPTVDRQFYQAATRIVPKFAATGKHTFHFRMGGTVAYSLSSLLKATSAFWRSLTVNCLGSPHERL